MFTNDVRFIEGRANVVADALSRPPDVPLGDVYKLPGPEDDLVAAVTRSATRMLAEAPSSDTSRSTTRNLTMRMRMPSKLIISIVITFLFIHPHLQSWRKLKP